MLDLGPERTFVSVDLVHEKRDQIIDIGGHFLNVTNEEKCLQNPRIKITAVSDVLDPADCRADNAFKEAFNRGVKGVKSVDRRAKRTRLAG